MSIHVTTISKFYGKQEAVKSISFSAEKGEIIGFLGPNGAGKSTTMKILTGYIKPDSGLVFVNGVDVVSQPKIAQQNIGYLPEHNPLYNEMFVREYLQFHASIYHVSNSKIEETIVQVGLLQEANKKIKYLSKGFQQRVGLAAAILHDPEVLILDEPTTGLDPNQLLEIRKLIISLGTNKTVLLSSHIMQEIEAVCNRVIIINKGMLLVDKSLSELKELQQQVIEVTFDYKIEEEFIKRIKGVVSFNYLHENSWVITFENHEDMRPKIFDFAQENGLKILALNTQNKNLESLFRDVTSSS